MTHALLLNLAILALIAVLTVLTHNPLCLAGLLALREMPYGLLVQPNAGAETDDCGRSIGFSADI